MNESIYKCNGCGVVRSTRQSLAGKPHQNCTQRLMGVWEPFEKTIQAQAWGNIDNIVCSDCDFQAATRNVMQLGVRCPNHYVSVLQCEGILVLESNKRMASARQVTNQYAPISGTAAEDNASAKKKPKKPPWRAPEKPRYDLRAITAHEDGTIHTFKDEHGFTHVECTCREFQTPTKSGGHICGHVKRAMFDEVDGTGASQVVVPMWTTPNVSVHVMLIPQSGSGNLAKAVLGWNPEWGHASDGTADLGFVTDNTGRWTLRELVIEYVQTQWALRGPSLTCSTPYHSVGHYQMTKNVEEDGTPNRWIMADVLDLIMYSKCHGCRLNDGIPDV